MMISCCGYVSNGFATLPGYAVNAGMLAALSEVVFNLWLLIKAVNVDQWQRRALESA